MCRIQRAIVASFVVMMLAGAMTGCESAAVLRQQGMDAYRVGDYALCKEKMGKVAADNPADWKAHWYLGRAALGEGNASEARMHLEVAYTLRGKGEPRHPETADIVDDLAHAILAQGDRARCISVCDEAIRNFGRVRDYTRKGDVLVKMGDADAATVAFLQAAKIGNYADASPYMKLADVYAQAGARQQAIEMLRVAYYLTPKDPRVSDRIKALGEVPGPTFARPPVQ